MKWFDRRDTKESKEFRLLVHLEQQTTERFLITQL